MPGKSHTQPPSYRLYKRTGQAVVTIDGKDIYLGPYGTAESREAYDRLIIEWLANGRKIPQAQTPDNVVLVVEIIAGYLNHAQQYYRKHGRPTRELANLKIVMRLLQSLYGMTEAVRFGPLALKAVREAMIQKGWSRTYINDQTGRIKRMFKWAVGNELVPPAIFHGLQAVAGLGKWRSEARETPSVKPVPDASVDSIKLHVSRQVWAMIELQRLTGMRPGEVVIMRGCDIDTSGSLWEYRPQRHKGEHLNLDRVVPLGPRSQAIVKTFLKSDLLARLFSPKEAEAERRAAVHAARITPLSCGNRPGSNRRQAPGRTPQDCYTIDSYRRAIVRACDTAFPAPEGLKAKEISTWRSDHRWHPHQLRHSAATRIRKELGLEAAQVHLGHTRADVTQVYAERNLSLARDIAARLG